MNRLTWIVLIAAGLGCAPAAHITPPPRVRSIVVLPVYNRTGDELLVSGTSLVEKYALHTDRVTVADVLTIEASDLLAQRGISVVSPPSADIATSVPKSVEAAAALAAHVQGAETALFIELRRWEADAPFHPTFVIVGLSATLIDAANGRVLWTANRPTAPVPTFGAVALGDAYDVAAHKVIEELLGSFDAPPTQ